jgi:hypothetical protein
MSHPPETKDLDEIQRHSIAKPNSEISQASGTTNIVHRAQGRKAALQQFHFTFQV